VTEETALHSVELFCVLGSSALLSLHSDSFEAPAGGVIVDANVMPDTFIRCDTMTRDPFAS
jgi:hypothetical protein